MRYSRKARRVTKHLRIRKKISGSAEIPRLCLYKSNRAIYLSLVDDQRSHTLLSLGSLKLGIPNTVDGASELTKQFVGKLKLKGFSKVKFDRSGYIYHGKVAAVAKTLREEGIQI